MSNNEIDFKVGDRVEVSSEYTSFMDIEFGGKKGTIKIFNNGSVGVKFDEYIEDLHDLNGECKAGYGWWIKLKYLKLVETNPKTKFKVGDIVRCVGESGRGFGWEKGKEFIIHNITDICDDGKFVYWPENGHGCYTTDIELIQSDTITIADMKVVSLASTDKMDVEKLKNFSKKNLTEGKIQALEEKANYEAKKSKEAYVTLINDKEGQERIIKVANDELKKIKDKLNIFK